MNNRTNLEYTKFKVLELELHSEFEIIRDGEFVLTHYATSDVKSSLCFVENEGYAIKASKNENISVIITTPELGVHIDSNKGLILTEKPKRLFFEIHNQLSKPYSFDKKETLIAKSADIASTAIIGDGVIIGERTKVGEYTVIEDGSIIGDDVLIENHVTIGGRGMHNTKIDNTFFHVLDLGNVIIKDKAEILSQAVIQKPYFYHSTIIGKETRISVGCNIGHGCLVGDRCLIAGHSIIAGYCKIGKDVWIGPNCTITHMINIDDYSNVLLGSVLIEDLKKSEIVSGNFALDHAKKLKSYIREKREKK
ncbi:MAG: hypothetical protein ABJI69_16175 [Balneola sp.]